MSSLSVPWLSYITYDHVKDRLLIYRSDQTKHDEKRDDPIVIDGEMIRDIIHKYDYRKLIYFSQNPLVQPFDTMLRFRWNAHSPYLRTQAICQSHTQGFHCVLIEDKMIHMLYPSWLHEKEFSLAMVFEQDHYERFGNEKDWLSLQSHLVHLFQKR